MDDEKRKKKLFWGESDDRALLVESLKKNSISITSTDTIFGFLGNYSPESYDKICELKQIHESRPFLLLVSSIEKLSGFVLLENVTDRMKSFLSACWPGPLTVIFKAKSGDKTIAVRCPDHAGLQEILPEFNGLFSTSANVTSEPAPQKFSDLSQELLKKVSYIVVDKGEEEVIKTKPSTIIDFSCNELASDIDSFPFRVIREGAYSIEKLKEVYDKVR